MENGIEIHKRLFLKIIISILLLNIFKIYNFLFEIYLLPFLVKQIFLLFKILQFILQFTNYISGTDNMKLFHLNIALKTIFLTLKLKIFIAK